MYCPQYQIDIRRDNMHLSLSMLLADDFDVLGAISSSGVYTKTGLFVYDVLQKRTEAMTEQANLKFLCLQLLIMSVVLPSSFAYCKLHAIMRKNSCSQGQPATQHRSCGKHT